MPLLTATYNIVVNQGTTLSLSAKLWGVSEEDPIDLTGYTAFMQVRRAPGLEVITELSTENGKITLGGEEGTVLLELSALETGHLALGRHFYDLLVTSSGDIRTRLMEGSFDVRPAISIPAE